MAAALRDLSPRMKDTEVGSEVTRMVYSKASYAAWSTIEGAARVLVVCDPTATDPHYYPKNSMAFLESVQKIKRATGGYMHMPQDVSEKIDALVKLVSPVMIVNADETTTQVYQRVAEWQKWALDLAKALKAIEPVAPSSAVSSVVSDCSVM